MAVSCDRFRGWLSLRPAVSPLESPLAAAHVPGLASEPRLVSPRRVLPMGNSFHCHFGPVSRTDVSSSAWQVHSRPRNRLPPGARLELRQPASLRAVVGRLHAENPRSGQQERDLCQQRSDPSRRAYLSPTAARSALATWSSELSWNRAVQRPRLKRRTLGPRRSINPGHSPENQQGRPADIG